MFDGLRNFLTKIKPNFVEGGKKWYYHSEKSEVELYIIFL